ncbi:MAG: helix-turn-helix transcriptional regulator [Acidovorax sp.]
MPQERILYADTAAWRVERVLKPAGVLHAGSPVYLVATPRWVFPVSGVSEFRMDGRQVLLDGLTVVALPTGLPYRIHEWQASERSHMVVSMQPGSAPTGAPGHALAWSLPPRALWQLRLHWRALAQGREQAAGPLLGQGMLRDSAMAHAAVARARRFMATRTAAADGMGWSLHDVADAACCSYFHLARLFRTHTGLGLHAYREQLRLAAALQRLDEGEGDLAALAHDLGYSSQSHLGTAFRSAIGVTPAQARQALRG